MPKKKVQLPPRMFLYTLDQIAVMLSMTVQSLHQTHLYYHQQETRKQPARLLRTHNINPDLEGRPEWRVSEAELIRWMKSRGFRYHERGWVE